MKFAFRTAAYPAWDFLTAATAAKTSEFDGVEIDASDARLADHAIFASTGIEICSLAYQLKSNGDGLLRAINLAASIGCKRVRVTTAKLTGRTSYEPFADVLLKAGDVAATCGVMILLENQPEPDASSRLWHAVDTFNHPCIACSWNMQNGRKAGELPLVTIPTLNSRIRMVRVGGNDPDMKKSIHRLRGIGFDGVLLIDVPQETLQTAAANLRGMFA